MKVTIREPSLAYGIKTVEPGDMFRFANGKQTDVVFIALDIEKQGYNTILHAKNLNTGEIHELYTNTHKERVIIFVEPLELIVRDVGNIEHKEPTPDDIEPSELNPEPT